MLFAASAATFLVAGCARPVPAPPPSSSLPRAAVAGRYGASEARIFDLINAERQRKGLAPLVWNEDLSRMAHIQAENMAYFHKMAHTLPEAQLPTLGDRARYVGYLFGRLAENVAVGYPDAETVVQGWMNSSGHRRNIMDADVVETGIGIARSSSGGLYYCQVFGRRRPANVL